MSTAAFRPTVADPLLEDLVSYVANREERDADYYRAASQLIDLAFAPGQDPPVRRPRVERPVFRLDELAAYLGMGKSFVRRIINSGAIPSHISGRERLFYVADVEAYLDQWEGTGVADERLMAEPGSGSWGYDAWPEDEQVYAHVLLADPCSYCGARTQAIDHIEPKAADGAHIWENFTAACQSCNSAKSSRPLLTFLLRRCGS